MFSSFVSSWRPCALTSAEKMEMQMHNQLPSFFSVIDHQSVPILKFLLFGDLCGCQHQFSQNGFVPVFCVLDHVQSVFLLRNYQNVHWSLWTDVSKSKHMLILVNNVCRNFFSDDFVKDSFVAHFLQKISYFCIKSV
jgi:hypothetical protein